MEDQATESKLYASFEKYDEFSSVQQTLLAADLTVIPSREEDKGELILLTKLCDILDEYQEQSYLLDPLLESLVMPVMDSLRSYVKSFVSSPYTLSSYARIDRLALLIYNYIKFRGYKTIIRFFPHEVEDLSIALSFLQLPTGPAQESSQWPLRYIILLWLSLICRIPFDLDQFDDHDHVGETANAIELTAKGYLSKAGLERHGAVVLLSRFYTRKDTMRQFRAFVEFSGPVLGESDIFSSIAVLHILAEIMKTGSAGQITAVVPAVMNVSEAVGQSKTLRDNTLVRKYRTKLLSRIGLRLLPARQKFSRRVRNLAGDYDSEPTLSHAADADVPEEIESVLGELFHHLQDKDTIVRWSAAKGVARLSERLPPEFAVQVFDTILGLFSIHSISAASMYDMPAIAEATWHGACLASAEMARRGLIAADSLAELVAWLSKALDFDIRTGAHSIGTNVRDAAAYAIWSLARAQDPSALAPHVTTLARKLVTVSLYDREIQIRRAASAAFQENVGRTGLFPHGIDVLRKTDFYAVSIRRNSFVIAAPEVAIHEEYRSCLLDHLINITLRHWDVSMRQLGAESLRAICELDLPQMGYKCISGVIRLFESVDTTDIHGALLALNELAKAYRASGDNQYIEQLNEIFGHLSKVPESLLFSSRNELLLAASCNLIANSISARETGPKEKSSVPHWRKIVDQGLRHRSVQVQEAAAVAISAVSSLNTLICEFKVGSPVIQQSLGHLLGALNYQAHDNNLAEVIDYLLNSVRENSPHRMLNIEARRNCYLAMPKILANIIPEINERLSAGKVCELINAMEGGLDDYTMDDRGDVGSWIRLACVRGLTSFSEILFSNSRDISNFRGYFPAKKYQSVVGKIIRQGVERLDNVRQAAGDCFLRLLKLPLPAVEKSDDYCIKGLTLMKELFLSDSELMSWSAGNWLFPKAVKMLDIEEYRRHILIGMIFSMATRTESTHRPASSSLAAYANSIPVTASDSAGYSLVGLANDLLAYARSQPSSNTVVVPVLQTFNLLLEEEALNRLLDNDEGSNTLQSLANFATKNIVRLKSMQRVQESMKVAVNLFTLPTLQASCIPALGSFLAHPFPRVRSSTAEYLYTILQSKDVGWESDEVESLLLETEWSSNDFANVDAAAQRIVNLISENMKAIR